MDRTQAHPVGFAGYHVAKQPGFCPTDCNLQSQATAVSVEPRLSKLIDLQGRQSLLLARHGVFYYRNDYQILLGFQRIVKNANGRDCCVSLCFIIDLWFLMDASGLYLSGHRFRQENVKTAHWAVFAFSDGRGEIRRAGLASLALSESPNCCRSAAASRAESALL